MITQVPAGGDLQAALNNAQPGDTVRIQAGAQFRGNYTLPPKPGTPHLLPVGLPGGPQPYHIIVRSDASDDLLARQGCRVDPVQHAPHLPKLISPSSGPALGTAGPNRQTGANTWAYWLIGLELTVDPSVPNSADQFKTANYGIVQLGDGNTTSLADVPTNLVFDRCYIHGNPGQNVRRGLALNSADTIITECYVSDIHLQFGQRSGWPDCQAIAGWNGPGPYLIVNSYIESGEENVFFGGQDPQIPNLVPSDIRIYGNFLTKPVQWRTGSPPGYIPGVKNLFELKSAQRVTLDSNVLENVWINRDQRAYAIVLGPRNQDGTAPQSTVRDVTIRNNIIRHTGSGVALFSVDDRPGFPTQAAQNITFDNNLFYDINGDKWGDQGTGQPADGRWVLFEGAGGASNFAFTHNTSFQTGAALVAVFEAIAPTQTPGFVFTNNLAVGTKSALAGDGVADGDQALAKYFVNPDVSGNVLTGVAAAQYPAGNFYPPSVTEVQLVDQAGGSCSIPDGGLCKLADSSPYKDKGTDGRDPGCDLAAVIAATAVATTACRDAGAPPSAHVSGGRTPKGQTPWQDYVEGGRRLGIYVDVDTSSGNFASAPVYISCIGGDSWHWETTGGSAVYFPTPTGFRVYVRWSGPDAGPNPGNPPDAQLARANGWQINWIGLGS